MSERLWAPWRLAYVQSADAKNADGCLFCALAQAEESEESLVLRRGEAVFAVLNAYPYASGHLMVAPFRHVADLAEFTDDELLEVGQWLRNAVAWLRAAYRPDAFNVGLNMGRAAGAGIPDHLHWHVVPRWAGDTNYMTTLADTRVIPQDLGASWRSLRAVIGE